MSWAQSSDTTGSITTFAPAGTCATIQARVRLRVSGRDRTTSLWTAADTLWPSISTVTAAIATTAGTRRVVISQRPNSTAP